MSDTVGRITFDSAPPGFSSRWSSRLVDDLVEKAKARTSKPASLPGDASAAIVVVPCSSCSGSGRAGSNGVRCRPCGGSGAR